jgi:hypothetical protein
MSLADALTDEKRKMLIALLNSFALGNQKNLLRLVLKRFWDRLSVGRAVRQVNLMLMKTVAGGVFDSFNKWKTLPEGSQNLA